MFSLKYLITSSLLLLLFFNSLQGQDTGSITISIPDFEFSRRGQLIVLIFESKEGFPTDINLAHRFSKSRGDNIGEMIGTFGAVPYGEYAIVAYYDKNSNNKLDTNFLGISKEPIGTSSGSKFRRLKFEKASFILNEPSKEFEIKLY